MNPLLTPETENITAHLTTWYVYMVRCSDASLYTGVTTDVNRRLIEHNSRKSGARYTRSRQPVSLVYVELFRKPQHSLLQGISVKKVS